MSLPSWHSILENETGMSGKAPLLAKRMIDAYVYEGKFDSTQIKLSLTGTAPLGGIGS